MAGSLHCRPPPQAQTNGTATVAQRPITMAERQEADLTPSTTCSGLEVTHLFSQLTHWPELVMWKAPPWLGAEPEYFASSSNVMTTPALHNHYTESSQLLQEV